jgi:hypothetical protein
LSFEDWYNYCIGLFETSLNSWSSKDGIPPPKLETPISMDEDPVQTYPHYHTIGTYYWVKGERYYSSGVIHIPFEFFEAFWATIKDKRDLEPKLLNAFLRSLAHEYGHYFYDYKGHRLYYSERLANIKATSITAKTKYRQAYDYITVGMDVIPSIRMSLRPGFIAWFEYWINYIVR